MVKCCLYFEHMQIMGELEPTKFLARNYEKTRSFVSHGNIAFIYMPHIITLIVKEACTMKKMEKFNGSAMLLININR